MKDKVYVVTQGEFDELYIITATTDEDLAFKIKNKFSNKKNSCGEIEVLDFYDSEFLLKPCYYFEFDKNGNVICSENRSNELYGYNEISRINYKGNFYANVVAENKEFALKIARERMNKYYLKIKK